MFKLLVLVSVVSVGLCMPGGYSDVKHDSSEWADYLALFSEVQNQLSLQQNDVQEIQSMEMQVVAGMNIKYHLLMTNGSKCSVILFYQAWTNTKQAGDMHCVSNKRQLAGGYQLQTDPKVISDYTDMLSKLEASEQLGLGHFAVQQVETQVVGGLNIKYTLLVDGATCHIVVFERVWTNTRQVSDNDCSKPARRQLMGGYSKIATSDPMVQQCLSMSLDSYNAQINSLWRRVELNIISARKQLVNGMNYEVTYQTQESTCMNNGDMMGKMAQDCPVNSNSASDPETIVGHCYKPFSGLMQVTGITKGLMVYSMDPDDETARIHRLIWFHAGRKCTFRFSCGLAQLDKVEKETTPDIQLDNDLNLSLKPISSVKTSLASPVYSVKGRVKDKIVKGKGRLTADDQPVITLLRKKRNVNFLIEKLHQRLGNSKDIDDIVEKGKALLGGGDDHDLVNHVKDLIGQDGHDLIKHGQKILGGDGHELVNHVEKILGGDNHDMIDHSKKLLGDDDHDFIPHAAKLLGGDVHDLVPHGEKILGGDDHDLVPHGQKILGGDDHDLVPHGEKILGGDDHDLVPHGQKILGGDDHDLVPHGQKILGGDDHDLVPHGQKILGGDDHDLVPHGQKILGGDDHDLVPHGQKILGGDNHDLVPHGQKILGGDTHDLVPHGQKILGGVTHDLVPHGKQNKTKNLGGDGHDYCHKGMFLEFKAKFNKLYGSDKEEEKRYYTFCDNMRTARKLQETEKGTAIYGATKFADLTKEEFQQYVGKQWDLKANRGMKRAAIPRGKAPTTFDWRDHGAVTPVKNQGSCGSCWAFSTTGNIEGQWAIKKQRLISLSEQELVDCDKVDEGCNGGLPSQAYKEIERLGGLETETDYSYKGEDEKCLFNKTDVKVYINDSVSISSNETDMASWLAANGPISIGINAFAMQFYMGGISHPWKIFCNPSELDHGVLIVGYGVQDDKPYWIVKNSWGADWGEKGYYLVYRGAGVCGLNTMCTSAVVD